MDERVKNIIEQEAALNAVTAHLGALETALRRWEELRPAFTDLLAYYESPQWREDYDASNRGAFSSIPCGVLSQDAVYNALAEQVALAHEAIRIARGYLDES